MTNENIVVVPRSFMVPIMINRKKELSYGNWDHPTKRINPKSKLSFVSFFDFDEQALADYQYAKVLIGEYPSNKDLIGRYALIENQYVNYQVPSKTTAKRGTPVSDLIELTEDTASHFVLADADLLGIMWVDGGINLELRLELQDGRFATLTCIRATGVIIDLRFKTGRKVGSPFSWDCRFERLNHAWRMIFDFAHEGEIDLMCDSAQIQYRPE